RRRQIAELHVRQENDPELNRVDSVSVPEGDEQRDLNDDRRVDIHQAADENQENIQQQEKQDRRVHGAGGPLDRARGNFLVDEVVREAERDPQDEQDAADEEPAFGHHAREILEDL